jgi:uncharacterized protein (TIGR02145 family)
MAQLLDKDGNIYNTVIIGDQEWTLENLKVTQYSNGTPVLYVGSNYEWANGIILNRQNLGALYNFYAAGKNGGSGIGSIAPSGWHVPTDVEIQTLATYLGGAATAGGAMKEIGITHWNDPNIDATNTSGFTSRGSGVRSEQGGDANLGEIAWYWCANDAFPAVPGWQSFYFGLRQLDGILDINNTGQRIGASIRLLKDDSDFVDSVVDYDGNSYNTVNIGGQIWMKENLKVEHFNDGTLIPVVTNSAAWQALGTPGDPVGTPALCYYGNEGGTLDGFYCFYENVTANGTEYGCLYNFYAVNHGVTVPGADLAYLTKGGIKEDGWRVPTLTDFQKLSTYIGGDAVAGGHMKEIGTTHWTTPNTGADNTSGFTSLPGGSRFTDGIFYVIGLLSSLWTNDNSIIYNDYDTSQFYYDIAPQDYIYGYSIRLVKDIEVNPEIPIIPQPPYSIGNFPDYRFYISSASSVSIEVFPLNFLAISLVDEKEKDMMFYRRKFNGTLTFGGHSKAIDLEKVTHDRCDDWDFFWSVETTDPCERLYLQIIKVVNGAELPDPYWEGYFSTTEGKFDIDRKLFEITPLPYDDFTLILEEADTQFDILANTSEVTTVANDGTINVTYTHNHWIIDCINYIASQIAPGTTIVSQFLTNATNPVTLAASKTNLLTIAQKSDIKRPDAPNPAQYPEGTISWNELMQILWGMFQVNWNYEALTDTIHIEHVSNFPVNPQGEVDIRTQLTCVATNKYSYVKEDMPKYEKFFWMEVQNVNFEGVPIRYESDCLNQDSETNTREIKLNVTTDLEYIFNATSDDPNTISDDGWVVLCNESDGGGGYQVAIELGNWNVETKLNMHLSWAMLHKRYWLHNRVLIEGYINNVVTQFYTSQKTRQQECTVIFCNPFNPNDVIKTELGESYFDAEKGEVKRAEISPSGEVKLTLMYGTKNYAITPPVADAPWIQITMTNCTHFEAILSEAAPVGGLTIEFQYVVMTLNPRATVCANAAPWDVWTIAEGDLIASYDLATLCPIPDPGCLYIYRVTPVPAEWVVSLIYDENCRC